MKIRGMETVASMCNTNKEKETMVKSYAQRQKEYRKRKKMEKQLHSAKKVPKTNAQHQRQFRQNQKNIQQSETLIIARKKDNAERAKRYRDKLKLKKQLDSLPSLKEDSLPTVVMENKIEIDHHHDTNCEEIIFSQFQMQTNQIQPSMNIEAQPVISPSFHSSEAPYEEHDESSTPDAWSHQETNIAGDEMSKSRADYMREYRQRKREEKLGTGVIKLNNLFRNSTQRKLDYRARAANSIPPSKRAARTSTATRNMVMGKSRADYMREYRQQKREEKLGNGGMKAEKDFRNSTQRNRDFRELAANSILSLRPTTSTSTAIPNIGVNLPSLRPPSLTFDTGQSTSSASVMRIHPAEVRLRPHLAEPRTLMREDIEQREQTTDNSTACQYNYHRKQSKIFDNYSAAIFSVCDRLWFEKNVKIPPSCSTDLLSTEEESEDSHEEDAAQACRTKPKRIEQYQSEAGHSFIPEESGTEDKYDILGRYVTLKVRQLDNKQRLFVERIINEAIYEGQMGTLNMNSQLVVNTETFVCGQTNDGRRIGIEVPEIKVGKEDCPRVKVEVDLEYPEDVPSEYEDVMDDESNSLDGAVLDGFSDHCSGAKRRRLEESDETILSQLVDASNIKAEVVTEDDNNLLENGETVTQLKTTKIVESKCSNNAKRKKLLETEDAKSFSEPHLGEVKVEVDIEENWNPLDSHSED